MDIQQNLRFTISPLFEEDPDKQKKMIVKFEKMHTESLLDLIEAADKLDNRAIGTLNATLDSSCSFFTTACSSFFRFITHIALAIIELIPAIFSDQSAGYFKACVYRGTIDLACMMTGVVGTIMPVVGRIFTRKLGEYVLSHVVKIELNHEGIRDAQVLRTLSSQIQMLHLMKTSLSLKTELLLQV